MSRKLPLAGVRVADMTTVVFGPYCTQILADLGADVIKVEPAEGDSARNIGVPPKTPLMGPVHLRLNRGKRSVSWDMKSEKGKLAVRRLLETSDVFIHNIRPEAIDRLGLGFELVKKLRPDIVYVHCTGFGLGGPYAGLQAYDDVIQAASGAVSLLPRVDGNPRPRYLPMLFADKVSGLHAVYATMAALIAKNRDGEGQHVEVPMFEAITSFNMLEHLCDATFVPPTGNWGYPRQLDPVRQPMRTKDGYISIAPLQSIGNAGRVSAAAWVGADICSVQRYTAPAMSEHATLMSDTLLAGAVRAAHFDDPRHRQRSLRRRTHGQRDPATRTTLP